MEKRQAPTTMPTYSIQAARLDQPSAPTKHLGSRGKARGPRGRMTFRASGQRGPGGRPAMEGPPAAGTGADEAVQEPPLLPLPGLPPLASGARSAAQGHPRLRLAAGTHETGVFRPGWGNLAKRPTTKRRRRQGVPNERKIPPRTKTAPGAGRPPSYGSPLAFYSSALIWPAWPGRGLASVLAESRPDTGAWERGMDP